MYRQPNAERVVILVNITRLATFLLNPVLTAVHLIIHAINVHHANPLRPAITERTKPAATDAPQPAPAVQLAQAVNRLLPAAVAVPAAVPAVEIILPQIAAVPEDIWLFYPDPLTDVVIFLKDHQPGLLLKLPLLNTVNVQTAPPSH